MKKIIPFLAVLAILATGIVYYVNSTQPTKTPTIASLSTEVQIQHPSWSGSIVPLPGNRDQRKNHSDTGTIKDVTSDSFVIVWDKWNIEVYKKNPKTGVYHLFETKKKEVTKVS